MATITPTPLLVGPKGSAKVQVMTWADVGYNDTCEAVELSELADRSVQFYGANWGAGGEFVFEGSNDGTNFATLKDPFGNDLDVTGNGLYAITEAVAYVRPRPTGGDGNTSVTISLLVRKGY